MWSQSKTSTIVFVLEKAFNCSSSLSIFSFEYGINLSWRACVKLTASNMPSICESFFSVFSSFARFLILHSNWFQLAISSKNNAKVSRILIRFFFKLVSFIAPRYASRTFVVILSKELIPTFANISKFVRSTARGIFSSSWNQLSKLNHPQKAETPIFKFTERLLFLIFLFFVNNCAKIAAGTQ